MEFNKNLQNLRKQCGLTQKELADKTGLSIGTIQGYEQGKYKPKSEQLIKLSIALGIPAQNLDPSSNLGYTHSDMELTEVLAKLEQGKEITEIEKQILSDFIQSEQFQTLYSKDTEFKLSQIKKRLIYVYERLNDKGKYKALEQVELLGKIPEYQKKNNE